MAEKLQELPQATLDLFAAYCGLRDSDTIRERAKHVWEEALKSYAYRCIQEYRFLLPRMSTHPRYNEIVRKDIQKLKILDVGCCMGTDIRMLLVHGANPANLMGIDINPDFIDLGFKLFGDADKLSGTFSLVNILADQNEGNVTGWTDFVQKYENHFDVLYAGSVLHLLEEQDIEKLLGRVLRLLRPGGTFLGRTVAQATTPGIAHRNVSTNNEGEEGKPQLRYLHTVGSIKELLQKMGYTNPNAQYIESDMRRNAEPSEERANWAFMVIDAQKP